jgi:hypothetical protein
MTALDRVRDALERHGSRSCDGGKTWTCPAHHDRNPSLALSQGDQRALLLCRAGCKTEAVVAALSLEMRDLFDDHPVPGPRTELVAAAPLPRVDIIGPPTEPQSRALAISRRVLRHETLGALGIVRVRCYGRNWLAIPALGDSWKLWGLDEAGKARRAEDGKLERKNVGAGIVRSPALRADPPAVQRLFDVEGESDLIAAVEAGLPHVICSTTGAKSTSCYDDHRDTLVELRPVEVVVVGDLDDPGRAGAKERAAWWRAAGFAVRILELPEQLGHGGDLRDYLNGRPARNGMPATEPLGDACDLDRIVEQAALELPENVGAEQLVSIDNDDSRDQDQEPAELVFPRSGLRGTFADTVELLRPVTGAGEAHVFAATWALLAACIGPRRRGSWSGPIVTPAYVVCVGPTGDYKSSAMLRVLDLLPDSVHRVDGVTTDAGLFDALEDVNGEQRLLYFDEIGSLLRVMGWKGQTLDSMLNQLWNAPPKLDRNTSKLNRSGGARSVSHPLVSVLAGTQVETFWRHLADPDLAIACGFVNRLAPFCVLRARGLPLTADPDEALIGQIRSRMESFTKLEPRKIVLADDAKPLWIEYSTEHDRTVQRLERIEAEVTRRVRDHVARVALVFATDAGHLEVTRRDLLDAIEVGAFVGASYAHLLAGRPLPRGGPEREGGIEVICRRLLSKRPAAGQKVRDLQRSWPTSPTPAANQIRKVLEAMDDVASDKPGKRAVYRLALEAHRPTPDTQPAENKGANRRVSDGPSDPRLSAP